jgi:hypothetical protein
VQPDHEQLALPFEGEVLVVLHKSEIHHTRSNRVVNAERRRLLWRCNHTARVLGFVLTGETWRTECRGDRLHIWLRAEAERS